VVCPAIGTTASCKKHSKIVYQSPYIALIQNAQQPPIGSLAASVKGDTTTLHNVKAQDIILKTPK